MFKLDLRAETMPETHIFDLGHEFFFGFQKAGNCCVQAVLQLIKSVQTPD